MHQLRYFGLGILSATLLAACPIASQDDAGSDDAGAVDARADASVQDLSTDTDTRDAACVSVASADICSVCNVDVDAGGAVDEHGLWIRVPADRDICREDFSGWTISQGKDVDWLCTLVYADINAIVYVQNHPTRCYLMRGCETASDGAWIYVEDAVGTIEASYDWGGNHANEAITVVYGDRKYNFYHSSFGYGWRSCHEPDCIQVFDLNDNLIDDGCTMERSIPAICVLVANDGSVAEFVDTFEPCLGDPNYP